MYDSRKTEKERFSVFGDTQRLALKTVYYQMLDWASNLRLFCEIRTKPWLRIFFGRRGRARSEPGGTQWRTEGEVKGKLANGVGSQYSHAISKRGVSSITQADAHTLAASVRLNWRPHRFKWTRPFRGKRKSGFCACAITFSRRRVFYRVSQRWNYLLDQNIFIFTHFKTKDYWLINILFNDAHL